MKRVLFIAGVGLSHSQTHGGMLVKNRYLLEYLKSKKNLKLKIIDTYRPGRNIAVSLFLNNIIRIYCIFLGFFSDVIIVSDTTGQANKIIRLLNYFQLQKKVTYFVIGGILHNKLKQQSFNLEHYKSLNNIYVESYKMKDQILEMGLKNTVRVPNFKTFDRIERNEKKTVTMPIKLLYIGKIIPEKGINLIIEALKIINEEKVKFTLDFYGPIEEDYKKAYFEKVEMYSFLKYRGSIDLINNVDDYFKLLYYDLFVFPTFWHGEGFPGVLIDSFIVGLPVLASDWQFNSEIINNDYNGIVFESENEGDLVEKLKYIENNKEILDDLGKNAYKSSEKYHTNNVLKFLDSLFK